MTNKHKHNSLYYQYKHSLNTRIIVNLSLYGLTFLVVMMLTLSIRGYLLVKAHYDSLCNVANQLMAAELDVNQLYDWYETRQVDTGLKSLQTRLNNLENSLHEEGVAHIQIVVPRVEDESMVYLVDTSYENADEVPYFKVEKMGRSDTNEETYDLLFTGTRETSSSIYVYKKTQLRDTFARRIETTKGKPIVIACTV